ncbi:MAG: phosphoribosylformylglycinamidine cyclo-ligase [Candidatus Omnitrophica bacterium]|nr:phosphoribosylformylglycinamidine cyclo-ligase [Candidatus Omnitrophota bacterium]
MKKKLTYKKAGVDVNKTDQIVSKIKTLSRSTNRAEVLGKIGNFSGFFSVPKKGMKNPVLVASTDGVGTKIMIATARNNYSTIGIDLVAMCVNDLITAGAEPLFFLDYYATGKVDSRNFLSILRGIVGGCRQAGCALLGGEIAEMPDCYEKNKYDLAGFTVGIVDKGNIIDGSKVKVGDVVIGIASSGLHSNGYSLARKIFTKQEIKRSKWGKLLLTPTKIYVKPILSLCSKIRVKSIVHITGGGLYDNIPRVIPKRMNVIINKNAWKVPHIFKEIQRRGNVAEKEMFRTFNMGIGMAVVMSKRDCQKAQKILAKERIDSFVIGKVVRGNNKVIIS